MSERKPGCKTALVVLGMHRSGTSAMTRVLGLSGAQLPSDLLPAGRGNERGHWESKSVIALDDEILDSVDSGWNDIFAGQPKPYLSQFDEVFHRKARDVIKSAFDDAHLIVLKDPRINVLSSFWDRTLRAEGYDPIYIIMVRSPLEVAASLIERDQIPTEQGLLMWLDHMLAAELDTHDAKRIFITYDDLLCGWRGCLDRIERTVGMPLPRRTSTASNAIEQFLSPSLKHQKFLGEEVRDVDSAHGIALQTYAWFKAIANQQAAPEYAVLDRMREYLAKLNNSVGPIIADYRKQISEYRKHVNGLEELVEYIRAELSASQSQCQDVNNQRDIIFAELAEYKKHTANLEELVAHLRHEIGTAQAKCQGVDDQHQTTLTELAEYKKHAANLEELVAHLRHEIGAAQVKSECVDDQHQTALTELAQYRKNVENLEEFVAHLQNEIAASQIQYQSAIEQHQLALAEIDEYKLNKASLEELNDHLLNEMIASVAKYKDAATEHEVARQLAEQDAGTLEARNSELRSEVFRLQATTESAIARSRTMERELAEASTNRWARDSLAAELDVTKLALASARQQLIDAEESNAALSNQILTLRAQVDRSENARRASENAQKVAEEGLAHARADVLALQQQREEILQSTIWRLTALPRRVLSKLRRELSAMFRRIG